MIYLCIATGHFIASPLSKLLVNRVESKYKSIEFMGKRKLMAVSQKVVPHRIRDSRVAAEIVNR